LADNILLDKLVDRAYTKVETSIDKYIDIKDKIFAITNMLVDWRKNKYTSISRKNLIIGVLALLYFISPYDIVPDFILMIGKRDNKFVMKKFIKYLDVEIDKYNTWKSSNI
jgi:uncharacterized membrane protein YkvA (DUF1232 family)